MNSLSLNWHKSISEIEKNDWFLLTRNNVNPFYQWDWLNALEKSKSISLLYGWKPNHLTVWNNKRLIGFAPLYLKNHSYGEFIFDQNFATLAQQLNLRYYPKIIGMSPFSPVEGYKFFISPNENSLEITECIFRNIDNYG